MMENRKYTPTYSFKGENARADHKSNKLSTLNCVRNRLSVSNEMNDFKTAGRCHKGREDT